MKVANLHLTLCHRKPERSFFWRGKQFPVCARCTGIHIGYLSMPVFLFGWLEIGLWWTIALVIPTYLDGFIQAYSKYTSNNIFRVVTGLVAGVGTMSLVALLGQWIGFRILDFIK